MINTIRYFASNATSRLGIAGLFSSLTRYPEGCRMRGKLVSCRVSVSASRAQAKAVAMLRGEDSWRGQTGDYIELIFPGEVELNTLILRERGSRCRRFSLKKPVRAGGRETWETFYESDKIERYRYCAFEEQRVKKIRFCLEQTVGRVTLAELSLYQEPKAVRRVPLRVSGYLPVKPEEFLSQTEEERRSLSGYLDTLNELMLFSAWGWDINGRFYYSKETTPETWEADRKLWLDSVRMVRELCADRKIKLIPTCFNPGKDTAASLRNHMEEITDHIAGVILEHGFDGVDFDWEFPRGKGEWELYGAFLLKMKEKLEPYGKTLSVCFADWGIKLPRQAIRAVDTMSYMAYDIIDFNGYHSSFGRAAVRAVEYAERLGFTRGQINLGIPYYARPTFFGKYWPAWKEETTLDYWKNYNRELLKDGIKMDGYYNSPGMCSDKAAYALQLGLGGIMVFSLACDKLAGDPLCLTDAIGRTLRARMEP